MWSCRRPQGEEQEFFVQLFMEPDPSLSLPSISNLISRMFLEQSIKFSEVRQICRLSGCGDVCVSADSS